MNGILKRVIVLLTALALVVVPSMTCFAETLEQDDDLIAGKMAAEVVVRPLALCCYVDRRSNFSRHPAVFRLGRQCRCRLRLPAGRSFQVHLQQTVG